MAKHTFQTIKQLDMKKVTVAQRKGATVLQDHRGQLIQARALPDNRTAQLEQNSSLKPNNTGLPNQLKAGIESLSGLSMDHVRVHYNSSQPAQLNAHAYAQGSDIHVAPGQEKHLPHEAWHVVQQAQGRVKATMQMKDGAKINDDAGLESEADVMGARALVQRKPQSNESALIGHGLNLPVKQLAAAKTSEEGGVGSTYKKVEYQDQASNFKGGADAGDYGLWPVGRAKIKGEYHDGTNWVSIPNGSEDTQQSTSEYYFCGHMLAKSLGGLGGADNIFAQDTNNNIGRWPSAEEAIRKKRDVLLPTDQMKVTIGLTGRDAKKLQNVEIKGKQLDVVDNTESKIAEKKLNF